MPFVLLTLQNTPIWVIITSCSKKGSPFWYLLKTKKKWIKQWPGGFSTHYSHLKTFWLLCDWRTEHIFVFFFVVFCRRSRKRLLLPRSQLLQQTLNAAAALKTFLNGERESPCINFGNSGINAPLSYEGARAFCRLFRACSKERTNIFLD